MVSRISGTHTAAASAEVSLDAVAFAEVSPAAGAATEITLLIAESTMAAEAALTAKAALTAAHHLIGDRADLLAVDIDCPPGEADAAVAIKSGLAVDADRSAADDDIAVGVYAVCVSRTHCDGDAAAGDLHSRDKGRRLARGIDELRIEKNINYEIQLTPMAQIRQYGAKTIRFS